MTNDMIVRSIGTERAKQIAAEYVKIVRKNGLSISQALVTFEIAKGQMERIPLSYPQKQGSGDSTENQISESEDQPVMIPAGGFYALNPNLQSNLESECKRIYTQTSSNNYQWAKSALGITNQQNLISLPNGWTIEKDADLNILRVYRTKRKD